jgi:hypothetical protein
MLHNFMEPFSGVGTPDSDSVEDALHESIPNSFNDRGADYGQMI